VFQEFYLHNYLTVSESISYAIKFKTGNSLSDAESDEKVCKILETFGLTECANQLTKYLSGGQQKRLSIAQEIVDDPKIIFLDECTTGLDSASSMQCINLLRKLADNGHTVICTIHQPSSRMLELFDNLYAIERGQCIYQGSFKSLVPFMRDCGVECPTNYNPAEYLLEICDNEYMIKKLNSESGKCRNIERKVSVDDLAFIFESKFDFCQQLNDVFRRQLIITSRNWKNTAIRILVHLFIGIVSGVMFYNIGNDASQIIQNYRLIMVLLIFPFYSAAYSQLTYSKASIHVKKNYSQHFLTFTVHESFPILKRECFNGWFKPEIFNIILLISDIHIQLICLFLYVTPIYLLSNQPLELYRYSTCLLIIFLVTLITQNFSLIASFSYRLMVRFFVKFVF
jgi:ABC-type multidrug transport system ATPase subunit